MAEQNSNVYPMISEKNWWTIREKFKASLPASVSSNYIKTLLSLSSDDSANNNVINPMRRIGLIDDENKPTALANNWRLDDKYKEVCDVIINNIYPRELSDLFSDSDVDRASARSWFMGHGVGEPTANKMVALFALLKSGEIKERKPTTSKKSTTKVKSSQNNNVSNSPDVKTNLNDNVSEKESKKHSNHPNLHIDLQIHISPDSTPEQIETIFASMSRHLYGANN